MQITKSKIETKSNSVIQRIYSFTVYLAFCSVLM